MDAPHARTRAALEIALELGFDLAGVAPLAPPPDAARFERWLAAGRHAGMAWLERDRERIVDPRRVLAGRSLLVVGLAHARAPVEVSGSSGSRAAGPGPEGARVARYAAGRDYHNRLGKLLAKLLRRLRSAGFGGRARRIVDAGPLLERSHAAEAGIGFPSKAANLLHPRFGPWVFLGELLLEDELEPTPGPPPGSCGTCTACLDACPTGAILEPGVVDANLCISYHTIESRAPAPHELRPAIGEWAFGCDVCSEVCPWGGHAPDASAGWGTHPALAEGSLVDWLRGEPASFAERFRGSPLSRARREGLARNAALALGVAPADEGRSALGEALERDPAPMVREAAAWGLLRAHGAEPGARAAVERALGREPDAPTAEGIRRSLEEAQRPSASPSMRPPI